MTESPFTDLTHVNVSGYSESKWVSERILWAACQETSLRPVIIRVGQLCGGINGNWNHKEWFPAMVTACRVLGGLPSYRGVSILSLSYLVEIVKFDSLCLARLVRSTSRGSFRHHRASTYV